MFYLIIYLVGVLQDFLLTLNFRYIAKDKILKAVITSFVVTAVSISVLYRIISQISAGSGVVTIVTYAAGIATGTFFGMKLKLEKK